MKSTTTGTDTEEDAADDGSAAHRMSERGDATTAAQLALPIVLVGTG